MRVRAAVLTLACFLTGCFGDEQIRPNIILVFTDDHAAHAVSAYGSVIDRTRNIDCLANEGELLTAGANAVSTEEPGGR